MMIYITRHGQPCPKDASEHAAGNHDVDYPPGDPPLSELGRLQAAKLGRRLRQLKFNGVIYASPYRRTAETADVIAEALGLGFYPEPAIREYTGPNIVDFNGLNLQQLKDMFPRLMPDSELAHPWWSHDPEVTDDEGYRPAVVARVGAVLEPLLALDNPDVLLVLHGASAGGALRYLSARRTHGQFRRPGRTWNCALTAYRFDEAGLEPLYHGDTDHLDLAAGEVTSNSRRIDSLAID